MSVGVAEVAEGDDPIRLLQRVEAAIGSENGTCCHCEQSFEAVDAVSTT